MSDSPVNHSEPGADGAPPDALPRRAPRISRNLVVAFLAAFLVFVVPVLLVAASVLLSQRAETANPNVPPVGEVWFGTSYNQSTQELAGRTSSFTTGSTAAVVAHLPRSVSSGETTLRITRNGGLLESQVSRARAIWSA